MNFCKTYSQLEVFHFIYLSIFLRSQWTQVKTPLDEKVHKGSQAPWPTSSVEGPHSVCSEDKLVVLVRARADARGARGGGAEGSGAGARRLLRSEHLRPRSEAPLAARSNSRARARAPARAVRRRDAAHGM